MTEHRSKKSISVRLWTFFPQAFQQIRLQAGISVTADNSDNRRAYRKGIPLEIPWTRVSPSVNQLWRRWLLHQVAQADIQLLVPSSGDSLLFSKTLDSRTEGRFFSRAPTWSRQIATQAKTCYIFLRPDLNRAERITSQCRFHVSLDQVLN